MLNKLENSYLFSEKKKKNPTSKKEEVMIIRLIGLLAVTLALTTLQADSSPSSTSRTKDDDDELAPGMRIPDDLEDDPEHLILMMLLNRRNFLDYPDPLGIPHFKVLGPFFVNVLLYWK